MDEADMTGDRMEAELAMLRRAINPNLAVGMPGECDQCGDEVPRLIEGNCPRCVDLLNRMRPRGYSR